MRLTCSTSAPTSSSIALTVGAARRVTHRREAQVRALAVVNLENIALLLPAVDDAFALQRRPNLRDALGQRAAVHLRLVVGRNLDSDAGEHLVEHVVPFGDVLALRLLEVAEEARQQLKVGPAGELLAPFGGEEHQRGPPDAVTFELGIQEAIRPQPVEVSAYGLLAQIQRFGKLMHARLTTAAHVAKDLVPGAFHVFRLRARPLISQHFCC